MGRDQTSRRVVCLAMMQIFAFEQLVALRWWPAEEGQQVGPRGSEGEAEVGFAQNHVALGDSLAAGPPSVSIEHLRRR